MSVDSAPAATAVARGFTKSKPDWIFRFGQWIHIHHWTPEDDTFLRCEYKHTMKSLRELSNQLGVTEDSVRQRLTRLGLLLSVVWWTKGEEQYLEDNYDKQSTRVIAERLHKSENSVIHKAHRMQVSKRVRDGWFTMGEAARILGVDSSWIRRRMHNGFEFEVRPFDEDKPPSKGNYSPHYISEKSLRDFIRRYPEELTGHNVDFVMLVDILAGVKN